jgi:hypothetical protein
MKKEKFLAISILLIGVVMLVESAASMFVFFSTAQYANIAAIMYILLKGIVGILAIMAGHINYKK